MAEDMSFYLKKYGNIIKYATNYHTDSLVPLLLQNRGEEHKKQAAEIAAAIALRNSIKTFDVRTLHRAAFYHTAHLIDKVEEKSNSSLSEREKKHKISRYCAAIAIRNGLHDDWPVLLKLIKIGAHFV